MIYVNNTRRLEELVKSVEGYKVLICVKIYFIKIERVYDRRLVVYDRIYVYCRFRNFFIYYYMIRILKI